MIIKRLNAKRIQNSEETNELKTMSFVASTSAPDRMGDIIDQSGWKLDNYANNPIVLLNHRPDMLPIAKGEPYIKDNKLHIKIEFDMDDGIASEVARKAKNGFINAVSVGFSAIEATPRNKLSIDSPYYADRGMLYKQAELLEVSIVSIPANQEAVAAKGYSLVNQEIIDNKIRDILRSELLAMPRFNVTRFVDMCKHIAEIEETEDRIIISFEKLTQVNNDADKATQSAGYAEDDEDEKDEKGFLGLNTEELFEVLTTIIKEVKDV